MTIWLVAQYYDPQMSRYDITLENVLGYFITESEADLYICHLKYSLDCDYGVYFAKYKLEICK